MARKAFRVCKYLVGVDSLPQYFASRGHAHGGVSSSSFLTTPQPPIRNASQKTQAKLLSPFVDATATLTTKKAIKVRSAAPIRGAIHHHGMLCFLPSGHFSCCDRPKLTTLARVMTASPRIAQCCSGPPHAGRAEEWRDLKRTLGHVRYMDEPHPQRSRADKPCTLTNTLPRQTMK